MLKQEFEGLSGTVIVTDDAITIRRDGFVNAMKFGSNSAKTIPTDKISAVQFSPAGWLLVGFIQFTLQGGVDAAGGALSANYDENSVTFVKKDNAKFEELHNIVQGIMAENRSGSAGPTIADELEKLHALVGKGIISEAEFDEQKRRLLSA